jgi:hypothetical protein
MSRKHLSDVRAQDILLKHHYVEGNGYDVYEIHMLRDYRVGAIPLGQLVFNPRSGQAWTNLRKALEGQRLQSFTPEGEDE